MTTKAKSLLTTSLIIISAIGVYLITRLFILKNFGHHYIPMEGVLLGFLLIGFYQQKLLSDWAFRFRYLLNAVALGLGCAFLGLLDLFILDDQKKLVLQLVFAFGSGFIWGLFLGLIDYYNIRKRRKSVSYTGKEHPLITGRAGRLNADKSYSHGLAFLLAKKMVFLAPGEPAQELVIKQINRMEISKAFSLSTTLILHLNTSETVTLNLSMPYYWMKKLKS